jgi:hypothetical protein
MLIPACVSGEGRKVPSEPPVDGNDTPRISPAAAAAAAATLIFRKFSSFHKLTQK